MKYHKNIGIPENIKFKTKDLISRFKNFNKKFTNHSFFALSDENNQESIKERIKEYIPSYNDVFEVVEYGTIEKIGFRIPFNEIKDIIFVMNDKGYILTLWTNSKTDNHKTLKTANYNTK